MSEKEREGGEIFSHGNHHSHSISCPFLDFNLNYKKKYFIFIITSIQATKLGAIHLNKLYTAFK